MCISDRFNPNGLQNGVYIFTVNENHTRACLDFNPIGDRYHTSLIQSSFDREAYFLQKLQDLDTHWIPQNIVIDRKNRKIYFDWYGNTCEDYLPTDWKTQLEHIIYELNELQIYKPSFYRKCFYSDNIGKLRTYSFYTACDYKDSFVDVDFYRPILNDDRKQLVEKLSKNGKLDVSLLIEKAFLEYLDWPDNVLKDCYFKFLKSNGASSP